MTMSAITKNIKPERKNYVYISTLAEQAERYDEMATSMKELVLNCVSETTEDLTVEERNLLSVAYKNAVGSRRASWRLIIAIEPREMKKNLDAKSILDEYRKAVEDELISICNEILTLLSDNLIPLATESESKVFYYKMKGDYYRYISELIREDSDDAASKAEESYQAATVIAEQELPPTHPIRLGLVLNYSVFKYEIVYQTHQACEMAKRAFDEAISEFDHVAEDSYRDATLIMQLLRDNLALWASDVTDNSAEGKAVKSGDTPEKEEKSS